MARCARNYGPGAGNIGCTAHAPARNTGRNDAGHGGLFVTRCLPSLQRHTHGVSGSPRRSMAVWNYAAVEPMSSMRLAAIRPIMLAAALGSCAIMRSTVTEQPNPTVPLAGMEAVTVMPM